MGVKNGFDLYGQGGPVFLVITSSLLVMIYLGLLATMLCPSHFLPTLLPHSSPSPSTVRSSCLFTSSLPPAPPCSPPTSTPASASPTSPPSPPSPSSPLSSSAASCTTGSPRPSPTCSLPTRRSSTTERRSRPAPST